MTGEPFRVEGTVSAAGLAIHGHVVDPARPGEALVVDLLLDGLPYAVARADRYDAALAEAGAPDPLHGFLFVLPQAVFEAVETAEVRLANTGIPVAPALRLPMEHRSVASALGPGHVAWLGGLRFSGWLPPDAPADLAVRGLIDGNKVAETRPEGWVTIDHGGTELAVRAFSLTLPRRFADGRAHHVEVVTGAGRTLTPVPLAFVAFADGLAAFLAAQADVAAEQVRGALYDRLMPQSLLFADVAAWRARFDGDGDRLSRPVTVVLVGDADPATSLRSLEAQGGGWTAGRIPLGARGTFAARILVEFLEGSGAAGEVVVFAQAGAVFQPGALERLATTALLADAAATCAYADVLLETADGPVLPVAHPAFDWERAVEGGYAASFFALRPAAALAAAREGADSLQKLFLLACRSAGVPPLHVPGFAARMPAPAPGHVQALVEAARGLATAPPAEIEPLAAGGDWPAIRLRRRPAACRVTAIVPFRDEVFALPRCLAALRAQASRHALDIVVVDEDGIAPDVADALAEAASDGATILRVPGPRNVARALNAGASAAAGDRLLFVDPRVALDAEAVEELVDRCAGPSVGAVGGLLLDTTGAIHDAGLVLRFSDGATPSFQGASVHDAGYGGLLRTARQVSAVSAAMMMVPREGFRGAGGFDDVHFPLVFPSVAYALAAATRRERIVVTPHARGTWMAGARPAAHHPARFARELARLRWLWPDALANDPFYSPLLNLDGPTHTALAWPPRDAAPRRPAVGPHLPKE